MTHSAAVLERQAFALSDPRWAMWHGAAWIRGQHDQISVLTAELEEDLAALRGAMPLLARLMGHLFEGPPIASASLAAEVEAGLLRIAAESDRAETRQFFEDLARGRTARYYSVAERLSDLAEVLMDLRQVIRISLLMYRLERQLVPPPAAGAPTDTAPSE